ncbi:LamG-like jellyroll fold domain-containing protein, partial [Muriicola sp.]|uniref:LamG-like jellyroll fold domain-containing protein n=1 Tax=Muriicola sp. TaxID=2020856 RepID=UPI003C72E6FB
DLGVGSVYRFNNALEGYDVLVEVVSTTDCSLVIMDDDTVDNPNYLQTRIEFTDSGTPGIDFRFTIVDTGTTTPASSLFRIGGTSWDVDGVESIEYTNPSAYGTDNPTVLEVTDQGGGIIRMRSTGILEGPGFSTLPQLRSYFQFLSNTFDLRMQLVRTTNGTSTREFSMSFTQCDIFDYKSPSLIIVNGEDTDNDGLNNEFDFDSDNDGIPDNVEAQPTIGYLTPNGIFDAVTGLDTAYPNGIMLTDTDGDNIPDNVDLDSDNDGIPDIQENGMADTIVTFTDADGDGLDDLFEGANLLDAADVNDEIDNPSSSILPDTDGDLFTGGDLDYRDASDFGSASIDFDGIDDYLDSDPILSNNLAATIMGWVKLDATFNNDAVLFGQDNISVEVDGATRLLTTTVNGISSTSVDALVLNQWAHIAVVYSSSLINGQYLRTFLNGEEISTNNNSGLNTGLDPSTTSFTIGKNATSDIQYFRGSIDEVRILDLALTESQIQQMVYQEIQQNGINIAGAVVPKALVDVTTSASIPWTNLQAYWPMTNISSSKTADASSYNRVATLYNITTIQPQTAPMPYETQADGDWTEESTWLNGDVLDIVDVPNNKDWGIVHIHDDVTTSASHTQLGMLIDNGGRLRVSGDNAITNNWYLQLDGTLDLLGDSQLIQTNTSDLVTSADGKILRRQEGNSNLYWYNYWASPVGSTAATTLSDNNAAGNNTNNSAFTVGMLKQGDGNAINFTTALDPPLTNPVTISSRWLYSFQNGLTYFNWVAMDQNTAILPGLGYTQKGSGAAGTEQQYIFEGKPNNGTILVAADDVDGDSANESEQDVTLTTTLVGNPYPSALDARQFILDNQASGIIDDNSDDPADSNIPSIQGTILLWEQWAGSSHLLAEYEGGYGYINLTSTERAYQYPGIPIAGQTQTQGIKTPSFYIPVGQGFFVEVVNDGNIEFNNGQRIFKKESDASANPEDGSVFFEANDNSNVTVGGTTQGNATSTSTNSSQMQLIRLEFAASSGATRRFVLGFSENTSDAFDYGYDGGIITDRPEEDLTSSFNDKPYAIQAFSSITPEKVVDLTLNASGSYSYSLDIVELVNIDQDQDIYIKDNQEGVVWNLRQGPYSFSANPGEDTERFDIVFQPEDTLSNDEFDTNTVVIFADNNQDKLFVKGLQEQAQSLTITNLLGQRIRTYTEPDNSALENGIDIGNLATGVYIA